MNPFLSTGPRAAPAAMPPPVPAGHSTAAVRHVAEPARVIDVSVCIANWNCRDLLRDCLASLDEFTQGLSVEVIVVDNASADGAADMVAGEFPHVILQRNLTNVGFARANNQAARQAHGRYLFFLNNDTVVPPGALRGLVDYADAHPELGMLGPRLRDGRGRVQISYRRRPTLAAFLNRVTLVKWLGLARGSYRRYRRHGFDPSRTRPVEMLLGAAVLLPRPVFLACGGWDEDFIFGGEDLELCFRVGRRYPLVYHPEVEIMHYGQASTRARIGPATSLIAAGFVRYFRKSGSSRRAVLFYKLLVTIDAPVEFLVRGIQYVLRRARGRTTRAQQSLLLLRGLGHFLAKGLIPFWRT